MKLSGVFVPATTPFDPVTGDLDIISFRRNARSWLGDGVSGLVLFGSTGEGLLLEPDERTRLLESVRELTEDGQLLLAGTGAESTRAAIRLSRAAADAGADAVLIHPPAYYKPQMSPESLRDHFEAVAEASPLPVILYQVPTAYSGIELQSGLVAQLSQHPNIVGIKDSSGDLKTLGALVENAATDGFSVVVGNGSILYAGLEVGATGGILAVAALAPRYSVELFRSKSGGDEAEAGRIQEQLAPLHRAVVGTLGVPGIKAAMDMLGLAGGPPRSPLKPLRYKQRAAVREALVSAGLLDEAVADR
ncbi:MAG: dihydrodipicolinate synthase family protein [Gemmatimonadetes bacterium]|nr:dihydrodipicolinate synthase family protein [Gemmatimonadota bacterium]